MNYSIISNNQKEDIDLYNYILNNESDWIKMNGGISNDVYLFDSKYIIKKLNKKNNNLFCSFDNFYKILQNLETTLIIDDINNIIIEKYINGTILSNEIIFNKDFCFKIYDVIDNINIQNYEIDNNNIIMKYITFLNNYIIENNLINNKYSIYKIFADTILLDLSKENHKLVFNHNDVQKYNILDVNNDLYLIDYEYSGYTWKYFDHANFIVLLFNEFITSYDMKDYQNFDIDYYIDFTIERYNIEKSYLLNLMYISSYTWFLWAIVKYHVKNEDLYSIYIKQMLFILEKLINIQIIM